MNKLVIRTLSAAVALIISTASYYFFNTTGLVFLVYLLITKSQFEYANISISEKFNLRKIWFLLISQVLMINMLLASLGYSYFLSNFQKPLFLFLVSIGILTLIHFKDCKSEKDLAPTKESIFSSVFGYVYLSLCPSFLIYLITLPQGLEIFLYLVFVVFFGDTFAFFSGILFGKKKVLPSVSPNKTWAGCIGGILGSVIGAFIIAKLFLTNFPINELILQAVLMGSFAQVGDFFESLLKRVKGVKDSGRIMPGHGGALDRIDGVLFAIPWLFIYFGL